MKTFSRLVLLTGIVGFTSSGAFAQRPGTQPEVIVNPSFATAPECPTVVSSIRFDVIIKNFSSKAVAFKFLGQNHTAQPQETKFFEYANTAPRCQPAVYPSIEYGTKGFSVGNANNADLYYGFYDRPEGLAFNFSRSAVSQRLRSVNAPTGFIRHQNFEGKLSPRTDLVSYLDSKFYFQRGLSDLKCFSLESVNIPGYFLTQNESRILLTKNDGTDYFANNATFCLRPGRVSGGFSLESYTLPGFFITHRNGLIGITNDTDPSTLASSTFVNSIP